MTAPNKNLNLQLNINGRVFTATRPDVNSPWSVDYPEGSFRYIGTRKEVELEIRAVAATLGDEQ